MFRRFRNVPERLEGAVRDFGPQQESAEMRYLVAAVSTIAEYLGRNLSGTPENRPKGEFLAYNTDDNPTINFRHPVRLIMIAEALFMLRSCHGFSEICRRMKNRDLRSSYYEALAALRFISAGYEVFAKPETMVRGDDFDFSVRRKRRFFWPLLGPKINVEVTALTADAFSQRTIGNALDQKRKQLPSDAPAVIFCVVPERWVAVERIDLEAELSQAADAFFKRSRRINLLVFVWERHMDIPGAAGATGFQVTIEKEFAHPKPRHYMPTIPFTKGDPDGAMRMADAAAKGDPHWAKHGAKPDSEFYRWVDYITARAKEVSHGS